MEILSTTYMSSNSCYLECFQESGHTIMFPLHPVPSYQLCTLQSSQSPTTISLKYSSSQSYIKVGFPFTPTASTLLINIYLICHFVLIIFVTKSTEGAAL